MTSSSWERELPPNVRVGEGCRFEHRRGTFERFSSRRDPGLVLGPGVQVFTWTAFSVEENGFVEVGEDSVLVGAAFMCAELISVGARTVISYNVSLADCDFHPVDPDLRRRDALANVPYGERPPRPQLTSSPVRIGDDVRIGIGAIVLKGVSIGDRARIGAGAVVTTDVPAGGRLEGNPGRLVGGGEP